MTEPRRRIRQVSRQATTAVKGYTEADVTWAEERTIALMSVGTPFVEAVHRASAECSDRIFVRQSLALLALEDLHQRQCNKAPAQQEAEEGRRRAALEALAAPGWGTCWRRNDEGALLTGRFMPVSRVPSYHDSVGVVNTATFPYFSKEIDVPPNDIAEVIRLLREAEKRSQTTVTHGDLQTFGTTVMSAIKEVGVRVDTVAATQNNQAVVLDQLGRRVAVVERTVGVNPTTGSLVPRRMTPSPIAAYDPEKTEGGKRRIISSEKWDEVETTLREHAAALEQVQTDLDAAQAEKEKAKVAEQRAQERQADIATYAAGLEKKARKNRNRFIAALVASGPILGGIVHFILEYVHGH